MGVERGRSMAAQPDGAPDAFKDSDCVGFDRGSCHTSRGGPATSTANPSNTASPSNTARPGNTASSSHTAGPTGTRTECRAHRAGGTTQADGPHRPGKP